MTLANRLMLLVLVALVPPVAVQIWGGLEQGQERRAALRRQSVTLTRELQGDLARMDEGIRQLLVALSEVPAIRERDAPACTAYLQAVAQRFSDYPLLAVNDRDGNIVCSSAGVAPGAYNNAERAYYRRALATGRFAVGDLVTGVSTHRRGIHYALPFRDPNGEMGGIVLVSVDQDWLARQVALSVPPGVMALVLDPSGTVVVATENGMPAPGSWIGQVAPEGLRTALAVTAPTAVTARGPNGRMRLFGALPLDAAMSGLTAVIGLDEEHAYADLRAAAWRGALGILLGAVLALLAGSIGARRFVLLPLARLAAAADRVGRGEFGAKAELERHSDELRVVGGAFDRMSAALAAREGERDRAEAAQRASERQYRTLFEAIEVGFCIVETAFDGDGVASDFRYLEVNPAFARQTGLTEVAGRWMTEVIADPDLRRVKLYGEVARTGQAIHFEDEVVELGRWFEVHAFQVDAPDDRHVALLFNDISERHRSEHAIQDLNASLERRIEEAVAERGRVEEALRQAQKMEVVGRLTGGVAHDFNNLLTVLKSSTDLLRRPNLPDERRRRYLDAMSDTVDRAAKLTGQLLAFSRRQALKPETFDAVARVQGIADMLDTVTGARVAIRVEMPEQPCHIRADPSQFETALVNMAVNARDAMAGEGTLTLAVRCDAELPMIRGHGGSRGPFVAVALSDTGAGISSELMPKIFEPFFTTKGVGEGTGLGLSQVFGFTKQSGGNIDVASDPSLGTTFTLYLPQVEPDRLVPVALPEKAVAEPDYIGRRVLIVEDNIEIGTFTTQFLQDLGYDVTWAKNAGDALARLSGPRPDVDVVFSDVVMPGMNGVDLAREIRRRFPLLPVVLASGYSHVLAQEGSQGFDLVHKPYSAEQVACALRRAMG